MCVIALIPANTPISKETLKKCFDKNPDSIGYMFPQDGKLMIRRFLKWKEFIRKWQEEFTETGMPFPFAVHFRIATSGGITLNNCHPFIIKEGIAYMHNGVMGAGCKDKSDTNLMRDKVLSPLFKKYDDPLSAPEIEFLLSAIAGYGNKFVTMDGTGAHIITGAEKGTWKAGVWFSNDHWDYTPPVYPSYNYGSANPAFWAPVKKEKEEGKKDDWKQKAPVRCSMCSDAWTYHASGLCHTCAIIDDYQGR